MNDFSHGGNLKSLAADARRPERDILDFSVNLRPEAPRNSSRAPCGAP